MDFKYRIVETHANMEGDWADVFLHDAVTDPIFRDGGDIVIPIPDGFIVQPNCGGNETDRYLQTGAVEIRLCNAECLTEIVPFEDSYDILRHKYFAEKSSCILHMFSNRTRRFRFVEFRCDSIEYRFDGFAGDSWIQNYRDHDRRRETWSEPIDRYVRQGHGAAVRLLRAMPSSPYDDQYSRYTGFPIEALYHDMRMSVRHANRKKINFRSFILKNIDNLYLI